jgi:hypothetical protein
MTAGNSSKKKMKKYSLLLVLAFASCYQQERNCADFKNGKFEFVQEINGVSKTATFERKGGLQIETFEGKIDTATVRWVNDCEYIIQKKHPKNRADKQAIDIKILTTSEKSYTFEYGFVGSDKKQRGTATKIK